MPAHMHAEQKQTLGTKIVFQRDRGELQQQNGPWSLDCQSPGVEEPSSHSKLLAVRKQMGNSAETLRFLSEASKAGLSPKYNGLDASLSSMTS